MPRKITIRKKRMFRRKKAGVRRRVPLKYDAKRIGGPQTARVVETISSLPLLVNQPYTLSVSGILGDRAQAHAPQYGLYRIAKVEYKHKPLYDTFIPSNQGPTPANNFITSVPNIYWKMNRFADAPAGFTAAQLQDMGAKPHRLDDKPYTIAYKPNILTSIASAGNNSGQLKMTPWLNTDAAPDTPTFVASTTSHYGHFLFIEADLVNTSTQPQVASMDVVITYEFKNPRVKWSTSNVSTSVNPLLSLSDSSGNSV